MGEGRPHERLSVVVLVLVVRALVARRVEESGDALTAHGGDARGEVVVGDVSPRIGELVEVAEPELPDRDDGRQLAVQLVEPGEVDGRLDDHGRGFDVVENLQEPRLPAPSIQRHRDRADHAGREVDHGHLEPAAAQHGDAVAVPDAPRHETAGERADATGELGAGEVEP